MFNPQSFKLQQGLLALILLVYLIVAGLFAIYTPPWQAPDEPAHYNYAAQIATDGCCPVIEPGDWDSAYLDQLKSAHFAPELLGNLPAVQYEDHQPPLYYLLQSLVYKLTGGSLTATRLFSALIGAGIVICTYAIARLLLPGHPHIALGGAALVAFLPQHVAVLASVNNDSLAGLIIGLTLVTTLLYLKNPNVDGLGLNHPTPLLLGLLVGIGQLTKLSTLFLIGLVFIAILLKWWTQKPATAGGTKRALSPLIVSFIAFALPVLILGGFEWVHNLTVYGFPDIFGQRQHNLVVADQPRTAQLIDSVGFGAYLQTAIQTTFNSFWGQFGWMALPLPGWMYTVFLGLVLVAGSGLVVGAIRLRNTPPTEESIETSAPHWKRNAWIIISLTALFAVLAYIYYNLEFLQLQGRYMFAGIIPFGLGMVLGVDAWRQTLLGRIKFARWLTPALFALLVPLDLYLLFRIIEPLLKP
jgi:hypothetical protein